MSNKHIKVICSVAAVVFFVGAWAGAQELEIATSPSPVGSGARAAGMADAFVAIADDATAASWNPAGLVQLEKPEISFVGSYNGVFERFSVPWHKEVRGLQSDQNLDINYLSFAYPLPFLVAGRNACVSLNYQRKYDFSRAFSLHFNRSSAASNGTVLNRLLTMDFDQTGGLSAITPAFAMEVTHRISLGLALNLWRSSFISDNSWRQTIDQQEISFFGPAVNYTLGHSEEEYRDFSGKNLTLGAMWNVTDKWSLGARYDSALTGKADYQFTGSSVNLWLPSTWFPTNLYVIPTTRKSEREVRFPSSFAVGTAFRPNDRLTLSLDVTHADWNEFYFKDEDGRRRSLVSATNLENPFTRPRFRPTNTVRFGSEYVFLPKEPEDELKRLWTVRGGLFYDQEPATGHIQTWSLFRRPGDGKPDSFYGFALGGGLLLRQRVNIDVAYQLRYGNNVNSDYIRGPKGFSEDAIQQRFLISTVVYFK